MISVIIPAYNIGKYISDCLNSIRRQTFKDYEVVAVNDGSKDDTLTVLNDYKKKYPEFPLTIIDKENEGVTAARRDGFIASKGEWICFVDGDDLLPENSLEILFGEVRPNVTAVCGSFEKFSDGKEDYSYFSIKIKEGVYPSKDVVQLILKGMFYSGPWGKLYHRDLIHNGVFNLSRDITNKEDVIFNMKVFSKAYGNIIMTYKPVYRYRIGRTDSAFYKMYVANKLNLSYELQIVGIMMDIINNMDKFCITHRDCISIFNYNRLWSWYRHFGNVSQGQYEMLKNMYREIRIKDISFDSTKKYLKMLLIRVSLFFCHPK